MTKKEILVKWLDEPRVKYGSESNMVLGYGDGWEWVKDTLRPASTKNATFLKALEFSLGEVRAYLKKEEHQGKYHRRGHDCVRNRLS